ncbi:8319_t:CDS:2 [Paraglomus brasilianum]|uniref:8319_t:CDS:1 n=1 Tax=Paraglomus brasilianum TaxID=144538 RepID=A0A9N8VM12_9GLOM|nr:8319_t:CDS:2 [Paraglomus brasilianum]
MATDLVANACQLITDKLKQEISTPYSSNSDPAIIRNDRHILAALHTCLLYLPSSPSDCLPTITILVDHVVRELYNYPHEDVPEYWRRIHTDASIIKAICEAKLARDKTDWKNVVKTIDVALVMSGAPGGRRDMMLDLIGEVEKVLAEIEENEDRHNNDCVDEPQPLQQPYISYPVPRHSTPPSISFFTSHIASSRQPIIIESSLSHWPALSSRPWSDLDYLTTLVGKHRQVPVEIGSKYTDDDWMQKFVSFGDYVQLIKTSDRCKDKYEKDHQECVTSDSSAKQQIAYLAQHNLFFQIPRLLDDIITPDYCFVDTGCSSEDDSMDVDINAWFGPSGTVSPLHTDPTHNLLAQVAGTKYVRLYAPEESYKLYPFDHNKTLGNTSQVDVESPDIAKFPLFESARYKECLLSPGDLLYIPAGGIMFDRLV